MSKFEGTWHYARQSAQSGTPVVKDLATICVEDDMGGKPSMVKIKLADDSMLMLRVDHMTDVDISFTNEENLRGRLVILATALPNLASSEDILIGSIHKPVPPASGEELRGQREDHDIDVFIAVKIC